MPWYLPELQLVSQDSIAVAGTFYVDCEINKLFDQLTGLISSEGLSAAASRFAGSYFTDYQQYLAVGDDFLASSFEIGESTGKLARSLLNFSIWVMKEN